MTLHPIHLKCLHSDQNLIDRLEVAMTITMDQAIVKMTTKTYQKRILEEAKIESGTINLLMIAVVMEEFLEIQRRVLIQTRRTTKILIISKDHTR